MAEAVSEAAASLEYDNVSIYASVSPMPIPPPEYTASLNLQNQCLPLLRYPQNEIIGGMAFIHRGLFTL